MSRLPLAARASAAWGRFWFAPTSTETLGLVRIFVSFTLVLKMIGTWGIYRGLGGLRLQLPHREGMSHGAFRLPVPGFEWLPPLDASDIRLGESLVLAGAVLLTLGLGTRLVSAGLACIGVYYLLESQWNYLHHVNVYVWVLVMFALAPMGDHYSIDAWLRGWWARRKGGVDVVPVRPALHGRMLQIFVSVLYITTTIGKLTPDWFTGRFMTVLGQQGWLKGPWKDTLLGLMPPPLLGWWTLFAEGLLGFGLWHPRTRRFTAWCGVSLHLGIDAMMNVTTFSYLMISLYLVFGEPKSKGNRLSTDPSVSWHRALAIFVWLFDWTRRFSITAGPAGEGLQVWPADGGPARRGADALVTVGGLLPITFMLGYWVEELWFAGRRLRAKRA